VSLPSGFVLKDSHLIRGVAALVVISVLVPGIFGVGPPQYFSDDSVQLAASDSKTDGTARPTSGVDAETAETTETSETVAAVPQPDAATALTIPQAEAEAAPEEPAVPARQPKADSTSEDGATGVEAEQRALASAAEQSMDADDSVTPSSETAMSDDASPESSQLAAVSVDPAPAVAAPATAADPVSSASGETGKDDGTSTKTGQPVTQSVTQPVTRPVTQPVTRAEIQQTIASLKPDMPEEQEEPAVRASKQGTDHDTVEVASLPRTAKLPKPGDPLKPFIVARTFHKRIAESHLALPVKEQKDAFIGMLLPLVLAANDEIAQRRQAIMRAAGNNDRTSLEKWARLYRIDISERSLDWVEDELLRRADAIPVSLALAQGAIESGWGTSRFALQGNALFGQWAWDQSAGLKPIEASNSRAVVRSFPNLFGSVRAYMHNLNTHAQYARFRERRDLLRGRKRNDLGMQLSVFLDGYAEIGMAYVDKIQTIIRINDLGQYEAARLQ
jgi:Bax protein